MEHKLGDLTLVTNQEASMLAELVDDDGESIDILTLKKMYDDLYAEYMAFNRDAYLNRIEGLKADLAAAQAIIVDAGQQVADLKAENAELRKDIEGLRKIVKAATEYVNGHFYAEPQWRLNRLFENMCTAMDTPQPKEDKQS